MYATVYMDGQPNKLCVLCQKALEQQKKIDSVLLKCNDNLLSYNLKTIRASNFEYANKCSSMVLFNIYTETKF